MKKQLHEMNGEQVLKYFINPEYTEYKMKKQTKKEKVLKLLSEGMKPKDIAAKLKIKTQQVYVIKSDEKKKENRNKINKCVEILDKIGRPEIAPRNIVVKQKSFFQKIKDFFGV